MMIIFIPRSLEYFSHKVPAEGVDRNLDKVSLIFL